MVCDVYRSLAVGSAVIVYFDLVFVGKREGDFVLKV